MDLSLLIIFWYGILHAFGPDHLTAIADFSIGKDKRKTLLITFLFAIGHGLSLFIFAKILESIKISEEILSYGDIISAVIIIAMGIYLLFMVIADKIHINKHIHNNREHIHIYFGDKHSHNSIDKSSSFSIGLLMGIGGVRGMLITLGAVDNGIINFNMVFAFTIGVILVFGLFGLLISYINQNFLNNITNIRKTFTIAGLISLVVGSNILIG
jgi:ABC-type nickel/cobalt efflux system permease component RcnA